MKLTNNRQNSCNNIDIYYIGYITIFPTSLCCNSINDAYAKLYVPDLVKNINVKVFNLIPRTNEARHIEWPETCKDKYRIECKELINKGIFHKRFIWNPRNCEYKCDKSCDVRECLDYNCKCRKNYLIN